MTIRNRIKGHRRVRAGDLVPHEDNWRTHPGAQREALEAIYREVGFARSLLAYELPDGRLKLIDGHLRRELHPDMEVDVEVLDVNDDESRKLLLTLDPLAGLAGADAEAVARLAEITRTESEALQRLWRQRDEAEAVVTKALEAAKEASVRERFLVLVECRDEEHQAELLERFQGEGLTCRALLS